MTLTLSTRGLALALIQLLIVAGIGGKLLVDRARLPRVWVEAAGYDPNLPIRGRYVSLSIGAEPGGDPPNAGFVFPVRLEVADRHLVAVPADDGAVHVTRAGLRGGAEEWRILEPVLYFIPEHAADPLHRSPGEKLWIELSVPDDAAPRPIRLGVNRGGVVEALPE
jgi:hypothetical protein